LKTQQEANLVSSSGIAFGGCVGLAHGVR
jgi:hypothetical protein